LKTKEQILIKELKDSLKEMVQKEIKELPKHLESLKKSYQKVFENNDTTTKSRADQSTRN